MTASLYERLGGTEGITQIASDLVELHIANPEIAPRFSNSDPNKLKNGAATFFIAGDRWSGCLQRKRHVGHS